MFGFTARPPASMLRDAQAEAAKAPLREVDFEEFVRCMVADGSSEREARLQAEVNRGLGGETLVGGVRLRCVG